MPDILQEDIPVGITSTLVAELERLQGLSNEGTGHHSIEEEQCFDVIAKISSSDTQRSHGSTLKDEGDESPEFSSSRGEEWTVLADIVERPAARVDRMPNLDAEAVRPAQADILQHTGTPQAASADSQHSSPASPSAHDYCLRRHSSSPRTASHGHQPSLHDCKFKKATGSSTTLQLNKFLAKDPHNNESHLCRRHTMSDIELLATEGRSSWKARLLERFSVRRFGHRHSDLSIRSIDPHSASASTESKVCAFSCGSKAGKLTLSLSRHIAKLHKY